MDIYLCDYSFDPIVMVDDYLTAIWTDRYSSYGEVKITFAEGSPTLDRIRLDYYFGFAESASHMIVETILRDTEKGIVTVTGRCLKSLLKRRINKAGVAGATGLAYEQSAAGAMELSVRTNCLENADSDDNFTNFRIGDNYLPWGGGPNGRRDMSARYCYDEVESISKYSDVGWKLQFRDRYEYGSGAVYWNKLIWHAYIGLDRTLDNSHQVIFDADLDNISGVTKLDSVEDSVTKVAVLDSRYSTGYRYRRVAAPRLDDFNINDRVFVQPMGNEEFANYTQAQWDELISSYAQAAYSEHKPVKILDGKLLGNGPYTYGFHYSLGDKVTIGMNTLFAVNARIVEHIWSHDANGIEKYPTFKVVD